MKLQSWLQIVAGFIPFWKKQRSERSYEASTHPKSPFLEYRKWSRDWEAKEIIAITGTFSYEKCRNELLGTGSASNVIKWYDFFCVSYARTTGFVLCSAWEYTLSKDVFWRGAGTHKLAVCPQVYEVNMVIGNELAAPFVIYVTLGEDADIVRCGEGVYSAKEYLYSEKFIEDMAKKGIVIDAVCDNRRTQ